MTSQLAGIGAYKAADDDACNLAVSASFARKGGDHRARMAARLMRTPDALGVLAAWGLSSTTAARLRLGLREPYVSRTTGASVERALSHQVLDRTGMPVGRNAHVNLPGVTLNPGHPRSWAAGDPCSCFLGRATAGATLVVLRDVVDQWRCAQLLAWRHPDIVLLAASHGERPPAEWHEEGFWDDWTSVVFDADVSPRGDAAVRAAAAHAPGRVRRLPESEGRWERMISERAGHGVVADAIRQAEPYNPPPLLPAALRAATAGLPGEFEARPILVEAGFHAGQLYHPVTVERRTAPGEGGGGLEQSWAVKVLRTDGALLDVVSLPAPAGTPAYRRVLALSDGTRILREPRPSLRRSWSFASVTAFVEDRGAGRDPMRRPLAVLLAEIERHLRSVVWLPTADGHLVAALFLLASFACRVFDAMPLLLVTGPRGSGKSELGAALAQLGPDGVVAGQLSAAGLVRLLDETRGLLVLDDLEGLSTGGQAMSELGQVLKTSYKQSTSVKPIPGRGGVVRMYDFYGPKVITNTTGLDEVLGSRAIALATGRPPARLGFEPAVGPAVDDAAARLRDEAHVWSMCAAADLASAYAGLRACTDRRDEIAAPLRAVAALSGDRSVVDRLEAALGPGVPAAAPVGPELVRRGLDAAIAAGCGSSVALPHLLMEMAVLAGGAELPAAEGVGRHLVTLGARRPEDAPVRRRLHGEIVRIYPIAPAYLASRSPGAASADPLDFCLDATCASCRLSAVCAVAVPGLRKARSARES